MLTSPSFLMSPIHCCDSARTEEHKCRVHTWEPRGNQGSQKKKMHLMALKYFHYHLFNLLIWLCSPKSGLGIHIIIKWTKCCLAKGHTELTGKDWKEPPAGCKVLLQSELLCVPSWTQRGGSRTQASLASGKTLFGPFYVPKSPGLFRGSELPKDQVPWRRSQPKV